MWTYDSLKLFQGDEGPFPVSASAQSQDFTITYYFVTTLLLTDIPITWTDMPALCAPNRFATCQRSGRNSTRRSQLHQCRNSTKTKWFVISPYISWDSFPWNKFNLENSFVIQQVSILCNDCETKSQVRFHVLAQKCPNCKSYNTRQTRGWSGFRVGCRNRLWMAYFPKSMHQALGSG